MVSENLRALETLLQRKRLLGQELLSMDGYERWGAAVDTEENRARMAADAERAANERTEVVRELTALVNRLRREDPEVVARWAEAHDALLRQFIEANRDAPPQSHESIGVFVAGGERSEWQAVKRGDKPFVEENVYYIRLDRESYKAAFDVEI